MAGAFGYGADTIDVSLAMGELSLLPAVRKAPDDALIVADGTSCRHQIHDGAGARGAACRPRAGDERLRRRPAADADAKITRMPCQASSDLARRLLPPAGMADRPREARPKMAPRVRDGRLWRVAAGSSEPEQDDATLLAIRDQERAGLDIITDGESGARAIPTASPPRSTASTSTIRARRINRSGKPIPVPRITGKIRRKHPVEVRDLQFLRANTDKPVKIDRARPVHDVEAGAERLLHSDEAMALDYAAAVNAEIKDLFAAGADVVQLDEPWMQQHPDQARDYGLKALDRALDGVTGTVAVHLCFGYAAVVHEKPSRLLVSAGVGGGPKAAQISIEAAQPKLD